MLSEEQLKAAYNGCKEGGHIAALRAVAEAAVKEERKVLVALLNASDELIADMRERAIMRGDFEIEDLPIIGGMGATKQVKIATLDCGNSTLIGMSQAQNAARLMIETNEHKT